MGSRGHGVIVNLGSYLPFVFTFNPEEVETEKKINYFQAPNVGGSHHEMFFTGFANKIAKFQVKCVDMENPLGVLGDIAFFEGIREPDAGLLVANSFFGNENYPPPQVLFGFGTGSIIPLVWDVLNVDIKASYFHAGKIRGVIGIPKVADIDIELSLDEDSVLFKANQIAKKATQVAGSAYSILREITHKVKGGRKEQPGFVDPMDLEL